MSKIAPQNNNTHGENSFSNNLRTNNIIINYCLYSKINVYHKRFLFAFSKTLLKITFRTITVSESAIYILDYNVQPIVKPLCNQHSSRLQTTVELSLIFETTTNNHGIMQILTRIFF